MDMWVAAFFYDKMTATNAITCSRGGASIMEGPGFAGLLRHYRRQRRLTQCELAERAGVSANSVSLLERGLTQAPQRATVNLLSMALDLTPEEATAFASSARRSAYRDAGAVAEANVADASHPSGALPVLPLPLTPVIGREPDVEQLLALLGQPVTRLLTLTGAAGVGKTRLALHLAAVWGESRAYDVVFVDLISVQEPERVLPTIAQALGVENTGTLPLRETVIRHLRERALLLVLDNFEQVLPAARTVVELLAACPLVQAVVTSRSALNVRGERCYPVAPLALPNAEQLDSLDAMRDVPSIGLFLDRACAVAPSFALATLDEGRLVAYICSQLDGLPLAIELAAAQVGHFGLRELHERFADPTFLGVLEAGPQDLGDHQRTMRSTIAWSYDLLSEPEQQMFRWLGVFVNGATLHALTTVLRISAETALRRLAALETAHLVMREETSAPRVTRSL